LRAQAGILALGFMLGACSTGYEVSPEVRRAEWEASNVYPRNYRAEILAYLRTYLNDPSDVHGAMASQPVLKPRGLGNRYQSCVRYGSAKDVRAGAPARDHLVIFADGKLESFLDAKEECAKAAYEPFPELEKLTR
jgi:hypothetical protein